MQNTPSLEEKLKNLPSTPGVYQFKDAAGALLYVGKAKVLRNRVRQYFQTRPNSPMLNAMISKIKDLEIITTDNEIEALILEQNLIQSLKPRYNINLKDDKSYPYIVITNEPFPRVFPTRKKRSDGSKYFGPYTDVKNMRFALKAVRDIFMIRSCNFHLTDETIAQKKYKLCLDYHIHKCEGPCEALVSREDYNDMINEVGKLLNGKTTTLINELKAKMEEYSEKMQFERAARTRDKINSIEVYSSKQKLIDHEEADRDIVAFDRVRGDCCGMILKVRDGKVAGKTHYFVSNVEETGDGEIMEKLITSHYSKTDFVPEQLYLMEEPEDPETVREWLMKKKQGRVEFVVPKIGDKYKLVFLVKKNARLLLDELILTKMKREFVAPSVESLRKDLRLSKLPRRIECYDISHIQGTDTVASMVVFVDGKPKKSDYRKFKIMTVLNETGTPDDFLSMREVIHRRFRRMAENEASEIEDGKNKFDESFSSEPDLVIIDGGKGQLSSAVKVLDDLGLKDIPVIGLAKKLEEVFFPGESDPFNIPKTSTGLRLLQRVRDEAHRFAVTFHKQLRNKRTLTTELTEVEGIGEKTAKKLLIEFGSVENLREVLKNNFNIVERSVGSKIAEKLRDALIIT